MNKQRRLVLIISILASFVAFLDGSVVGVALPSITKELGGGLATQQWVNDAYLITLGSLILVAGSVSDIFGRKKALSVGLIGFGAASLLCAFAPTSEFLIVSRGVQGIAAALLIPSSLALIISTFSGEGEAKAIGTWTAWISAAFIVGPLVGGVLVDSASWRYVFAINIVPIVATIWLMKSLDVSDVLKKERVDIFGAVLSAAGLGGIVYALIEQSKYGWGSPMIYLTFAAGIILLGAFVYRQKRIVHPMMPLGLFRKGNFGAGNIATFFVYGALSLMSFVLVIFLQQVGHFSALAAGATTMPVTILLFLLSSKFGAMSEKYGPRIFMALGPVVSGAGALTLLLVDERALYVPYLLIGTLLFGVGMSITVAPLTSAILKSIHPSQAGIGSAINNAVSRIAGLLSIAVIGVFIGTSIDMNGFRVAMWLSAGLFLLGGLVSAVGIRNDVIAD